MHWITSVGGGPQRVNHAAVNVRTNIYSFGGYSSDEVYDFSQIDIHVFDTIQLKWESVKYKNQPEAPKKCYGHTVVNYRGKIYLWGGRSNYSASNTLYCFNTVKWTWSIIPVTGTIPSKVDGHSACVINDYMYVFGGYEEETEMFTNVVHRLNLINFKWEKVKAIGEPPCSRDFHTASVIDNRMYIFGGRSCKSDITDEEIYSNEIMYLDTVSMRWIKPSWKGTAPCGRRSHSAAVYNNEIYVIGGFDGETRYHLNDVYRYSPATSTWTRMHPNGDPPCPRRRHCACVVDQQLFLFGGSSPENADEYARRYTAEEGFNHLRLLDHSDLYVLDFAPSLKKLCQLKILSSRISTNNLPQILKKEISILCTNEELRAFYTEDARTDFPAFGFSA